MLTDSVVRTYVCLLCIFTVAVADLRNTDIPPTRRMAAEFHYKPNCDVSGVARLPTGPVASRDSMDQGTNWASLFLNNLSRTEIVLFAHNTLRNNKNKELRLFASNAIQPTSTLRTLKISSISISQNSLLSY